MDTIRTQAGLAYSVSSMFAALKSAGPFEIVMQTKTVSVEDAIRRAREQTELIRTAPIRDDELQEAKRYLTGSFPLRLDSNAKIADFIAQVWFYDLGMDYPDKYIERVSAVTLADVQRVAEAYIHPDQFTEVVVTNPTPRQPARRRGHRRRKKRPAPAHRRHPPAAEARAAGRIAHGEPRSHNAGARAPARRGRRPPPAQAPAPNLPDALGWAAPVLIALAALLAYANSVSNGFVWDDPIILTRQLVVFRTVGDVLTPPRDIPQFSPTTIGR
jgi:hypothetical protein